MATTADPFAVLGVSEDAHDEVIKAAYKALAFKFHPDRNSNDPAAAASFHAVAAAFDVLSDPTEKARAIRARKASRGASASGASVPRAESPSTNDVPKPANRSGARLSVAVVGTAFVVVVLVVGYSLVRWATAAPEGSVIITLDHNNPDAEVRVDGQPANLNVKVTMLVGPHLFELLIKGNVTLTKVIDVGEGIEPIQFNTMPTPDEARPRARPVGLPGTGSLVVQVVPSASASVLVDGKGNAEPGNFVFHNLSPGPHQMVVTSPDSDAVSQMVTIESDQTAVLKVALKSDGAIPLAGSSQLALDVPNGATITIDGKPYGTAPVGPANLYPGPHSVLVKFKGAETVQRVDMRASRNLTLTVRPK